MILLLILVLLVIAVVSIFWAASIGAGKGYPWWVGALAGFLLGLIGVLIMALMSDRGITTLPAASRSHRSLKEAFAANRQPSYPERRQEAYTTRTAADYLAPGTRPESQGRTATATETLQSEAVGPGLRVAEELERLAALRDQGILTEAEFAAQKAKILGA